MAGWVDKYTQGLKITTGDGKVWELLTLPSFTKELEFNGTPFNFVDIDLPLIDKRKIASRAFPLEFYFVGEFNIEDASLFEISCRNSDPWLIEHPYYNTILAQALKIKFDDTELNVTKITCVAEETITKEGLNITKNPIDVVILKKIELDALLSEEPILNPTITDINTVKSNTEKNYQEGIKIIKIPEDAEKYFNSFNTAISTINTITETPILAMQALTNFITAPAEFYAAVQDRIRIFKNQYDILRRTLLGLTTVSAKQLYQSQGACLLSSMCFAAVTPLTTDYSNAAAAELIKDIIGSNYKIFKSDLDSIQSPNGGNPDYFIPAFDIINVLDDLINVTTSNLFQIALSGRKEFSYVLPDDTNVILLTQRFYKLDKDDNNINEFISNNKIEFEEIALGLPKGKTVVYYA